MDLQYLVSPAQSESTKPIVASVEDAGKETSYVLLTMIGRLMDGRSV